MWSRESFTEGPRKEKDGSRSKRPPILDGFLGKVLIGRIWGGPQGSWLSSDGLVVRWQGSVPGISCSAEVAILPRGGGQRRTRRYCSVRPLSRKQDPAPWPRYRFFLQSLTSLTNPHPHPHPVRTQGRSGKLKKSPRNKKKGGDRARLLYPGRLHRIQFQFHWHSLKSVCWHFMLITLAYLNSKDPCLSANVRLFFFFKAFAFHIIY